METMEKYDEKKDYPKCVQAYKSGGFHMNYDKDEKVKEILIQTSKDAAKLLLAGQFLNLTNLPKPIAMCSTITVTETQALQFQTLPFYLTKGAEAKDPVTKMKYTISAFLSSLYRTLDFLGSKISLDPKAGETLQVMQEDGSLFYGETIERSPTITAFQLIGPNENYKVLGSAKFLKSYLNFVFRMDADFKGVNMLRGYKHGKTLVKYSDGTEHQVTNPILLSLFYSFYIYQRN